jgi:hypothetical protein
MDSFTQAIEGWHDFYIMIGTAAATLTGLLFVGLSINADMLRGKTSAELSVLAGQAFSNFIFVLMFAVLFLIPDQSPRGLGLPLLGIDAYGLYMLVRRFLQARRGHSRIRGTAGLARRFVLPTLCFVTLMVIGISVLLGRTDGLYWLVPVMILLIVDASLNAWALLIRPLGPASPHQ